MDPTQTEPEAIAINAPLTKEALVEALVHLLDLETLDVDLYRGRRKPGGKGRVFGGQVIGQALRAAMASVDGPKIAHSLHAYFMRPGNEDFPIVFRVVRDFDGGSFSNRRVIATQGGQPILNMAASFHKVERGYFHQDIMPDVPDPDTLEPETALRAKVIDSVPESWRGAFLTPRPIEIRPVAGLAWLQKEPGPPLIRSWFRAVAPLGDDPNVHRAVLAYASDMQLLGTCTLPHGKSWVRGELMTASLDHALWFHDDFRADDWLLYCTDSPWAGRARGINRGLIFARDGRLVASVAQEGLIRPLEPLPDPSPAG